MNFWIKKSGTRELTVPAGIKINNEGCRREDQLKQIMAAFPRSCHDLANGLYKNYTMEKFYSIRKIGFFSSLFSKSSGESSFTY